MYLPDIGTISQSRTMVSAFAGIDRRPIISESAFADEENLTSDMYPVFSVRKARAYRALISGLEGGSPTNLCGRSKLCYVYGSSVVVGGSVVPGVSVTPGEKKVASLGAYMIIFPDKVYVNTIDISDSGSLLREYDLHYMISNVKVSVCDANGVKPRFNSTLPPSGSDGGEEAIDSAEPTPGDLWLMPGTETSDPRLFRFVTNESGSGKWEQTDDSFLQIGGDGWSAASGGLKIPPDQIQEYDRITIDGFSGDAAACNGDHEVFRPSYALTGDYAGYAYNFMIKGIMSVPSVQYSGSSTHAVMRNYVPDMDFICGSGGRLWGCKFGKVNGETINEIYASSNNDFFRFGRVTPSPGYEESWTASVGTDGPFTGCIEYSGCPFFFKENAIHKVVGSDPSSFTLYDISERGVANGCWRSLIVCNEVLYYRSTRAVVGYDGSAPVDVSEALGDLSSWQNAVGGTVGSKVYMAMQTGGVGAWKLHVFDTRYGIWHIEDCLPTESMTQYQDELYMTDTHNGRIVSVTGKVGTADAKNVAWNATTGIIGLDNPDNKYISRVAIRMSIGKGADVNVSIEYDSCGTFRSLFSLDSAGHSLKTVTAPIMPRRCDHFRLRFTGHGDVRIFSITKTMEKGSDF